MKVVHFPLEVNYVNVFLAISETSNEAFLIDCGAWDQSIQNYILKNKIELRFLLVTHTHYDHIDGISEFKQSFDVPIYSATPRYDQEVSEGDEIPFDDGKIAVLETPGHIADGVSYHLDRTVFVGDAIFAGAVGGTASRGLFEEGIRHVREKILTLPAETEIYPGHGAPSLVGVERLFNPFFR